MIQPISSYVLRTFDSSPPKFGKLVFFLICYDPFFIRLKAIQAEKYPVVKIKKPPGRPRADASLHNENSKDSMSVAGESNQGNDDDDDDEEEEDDDDDDDDDEGGGGDNGGDGSEESDDEDVSN